MQKITIKPAPLTQAQRGIFDICRLDNTQYDTICVVTGRQCGKTFLDIQVAFMWALQRSNYKVGFYMPYNKQIVKVIQDIETWTRGWGTLLKFNKTQKTIIFPNGSMIKFIHTGNEGMRGETFQSIIVDEACLIDDKMWSILQITAGVSLSKNNGKMLITSTPKRKNWFYKLFNSEAPNVFSYRMTTEEGGLISRAIIENFKETMPEALFRNEFLGEFIDAGTGFFEYRDLLFCPSLVPTLSQKANVAAIDWGFENDYTVLTILNDNNELICIHRERGDVTKIAPKLAKLLNHYNPKQVFAEKNGVGVSSNNVLRKLYPKLQDFYTDENKKMKMIPQLAQDIKSKDIKLFDDEELKREFDNFGFKYDKNTGKMKFGSESGHDDIIMSLAIANFNRFAGLTTRFM